MNKQIFENIYNLSMESTIEIFFSSTEDFFLTEKDLHCYFFHSFLKEKKFEYKNKLLIHTEYPMPFRAKTTKDKNNPIKIIMDDVKIGRPKRPSIDSVLFNKNFIDWIFKHEPARNREKYRSKYSTDDYRNDCIRGLCIYNESFSDYINDFRKTYNEFYKETKESFLSHSLEFKYFKGGEGIQVPIDEIKYDLKKLSFIAEKNEIIKEINFPFCDKCTLLVFVGKRGSGEIITELDKLKEDQLFQLFRGEVKYSENRERCVIRYDFRK